jgi:hypothetical protein
MKAVLVPTPSAQSSAKASRDTITELCPSSTISRSYVQGKTLLTCSRAVRVSDEIAVGRSGAGLTGCRHGVFVRVVRKAPTSAPFREYL